MEGSGRLSTWTPRPQENIAWQIPHSNHWLARINCQQANAELLSMVRPAEGNNIKRCYLSHDEGDGNGEFPSDPDECRHLGHIKAIPYGHNRNFRIIRRARVAIEEDNWFVMNWNFYGPKVDICYRIPGPKNTWIARISNRTNEGELLRIVGHHSSQEQQRWDRVHYITSESHMGEDAVSFIVECVKRTATGRLFHKATGPEKIPALQQRMGFQVIEV